NAIGADAPGKEELDPEVLLRARIIVDDMEQAVHSGEVNVPILKGLLKQQKIAGEIGQVLEGKIKGRTSEKEITVFDSTGLAIQDIASASLALRRAVEKGIGVKLRLF
ncbi:MAG: ornithine cyclodeaminase family protein, partial [Nitrososphaerota archaeon]|nr:ornithine cyclodeaminase family protein [Nitrososphaerota archaeon]